MLFGFGGYLFGVGLVDFMRPHFNKRNFILVFIIFTIFPLGAAVAYASNELCCEIININDTYSSATCIPMFASSYYLMSAATVLGFIVSVSSCCVRRW